MAEEKENNQFPLLKAKDPTLNRDYLNELMFAEDPQAKVKSPDSKISSIKSECQPGDDVEPDENSMCFVIAIVLSCMYI